MSAAPSADLDDLCFTARALAQTHPMTESSLRYRHDRHAGERIRQPATEIADWASTALLVGYCLRRAEEQTMAVSPRVRELAPDRYESAAVAIAARLCGADGDAATHLGADAVNGALDRLIATELEKRHEHVREQLDAAAWTELKTYIAWWVVHGYCVRTAETS